MTVLIDMDAQNAAALLQFYVESGAFDGIGDEPINRYELAPPAQQPSIAESVSSPAPEARRRAPIERPSFASPDKDRSRASSPATIPLDAIPQDAVAEAENARAIAQSCISLEELKGALSAFNACPLKSTAKSLVFADGNAQADVMLLGDAPGRDEDIQGLPFVGQVGQLLDRMLASIALDRSNTYLTNVLPWRPPGNRTPTASELAMCAPFVERHIELAAPKLLLLLGAVSAKQMLGSNSGIMKLRGNWGTVKVGALEIPTLTTFHPSYLLKQPAHKRLAWRDLLAFKAKLAGL